MKLTLIFKASDASSNCLILDALTKNQSSCHIQLQHMLFTPMEKHEQVKSPSTGNAESRLEHMISFFDQNASGTIGEAEFVQVPWLTGILESWIGTWRASYLSHCHGHHFDMC